MKDIFEQLKTERLSRGWTLQDVSDRTGISITVLKALESGNSDKLIAPSAVEDLLRKYAAALEAPTEQIADSGQKTTDAWKAKTEQIADSAQKTTESDGPKPGKTSRCILKGALFIVVLAAAFLATVLWQTWETKDSSEKSHEPAVSQTGTVPSITSNSSVKPHEPAVSQTGTVPSITSEQKPSSGNEDLAIQHRESPEVEKQPPESPPPDAALSLVPTPQQDAILLAEPEQKSVASIQPPATVRPAHSLEMVTDQRTWIEVVVDGRNTETELLEAGETRKWQAMDKVDLVVGNGGGVHLRWDGKPVEISSRRGSVVRLTLPKP